MRYKLLGNNDTNNIIQTILNNRGIKDWKKYLSLSFSSRETYKDLDDIKIAVETFDKHFQNKDPIAILQDCDVDGLTSCTTMYKYIKCLDENYDVRLYVHRKNKSHGLNDNDFDIDEDIKLLIVPDAGSNDVAEHKSLYNMGIDCICLDHHQVNIDIKESPAIIINNQTSDNYQNKNCCGASITLEFCRALDDYYWEEYADDFLDLVAVANVCDVMSLKEFETRAIVNEGLNNIKNKMLEEIIKAQDFSMKGIISPHTVGFYIGPLCNAFIRLATYEERQLLIRAFCEDESETFEYIKRGEVLPTEENIYQHCVRLMKSYKGKQDRARDKAFNVLMKQASKNELDKVAIIDASEELDSAYTGLVAIKLSESLHKPVLLVRETSEGYAGSGRSFDYCPIEDFRELVNQCPSSTLAQGHPSAFGTCLTDIDSAKEWFNEQLKNISFDKVYVVDFNVNSENIQVSWCQELDKYKTVFAHGVDEPLWRIMSLHISNENTKIIGKNHDTIQIYDDETGIKYVMFKCDEHNELLNWLNNNLGDEETWINIIGILELNEYQGVYTPQVNIKELELKER